MKLPDGIAVDLGGSKIVAGRFNNGVLEKSRRVVTDGDAGAEHQIAVMVELMQDLNLGTEEKFGVAVAGRINAQGEWFAVNKRILKSIHHVALKSILEERLQRPVNVVNDAVAGGVAEAHYGAGQCVTAFAYITVSTGVGGACVLNGKPVTSANGLAGHVGFTTTRERAGACGSGRYATIESIASGRAMEEISLSINKHRSSAKEIFAFAAQGQTWAQEIVDTSARAIAELSTNLACALGIERVVLGGSIGLLPEYQQRIKAAIANEPAEFQVSVAPALLGQNAVMAGALCFDQYP